jgi:hypothetical protein
METHQPDTQFPSATPPGGELISLVQDASLDKDHVSGVKGPREKGTEFPPELEEKMRLSEGEVKEIQRMLNDPIGMVRWIY